LPEDIITGSSISLISHPVVVTFLEIAVVMFRYLDGLIRRINIFILAGINMLIYGTSEPILGLKKLY
jgi:hypothetical protein